MSEAIARAFADSVEWARADQYRWSIAARNLTSV